MKVSPVMLSAARACLRAAGRVLLVGLATVLPAVGVGAEEPPAELPLAAVFRLKPADGAFRLVTREVIESEGLQAQVEGVAFRAVVTNSYEWPAGLVAVFAVKHGDRFELRRRPVEGEENQAEPLFFALPPDDEPDVAKIAGRWELNATRGDGSRAHLAMDLAVETNQVAARFDPNSEYRFAEITGGTFRQHRLELRVKYINDRYLLTGDWQHQRLAGDWRREDEEERGTWKASRREVRVLAGGDAVPLHAWHRAADGVRRYAPADAVLGPGWKRSARPLCRVWRAAP